MFVALFCADLSVANPGDGVIGTMALRTSRLISQTNAFRETKQIAVLDWPQISIRLAMHTNTSITASAFPVIPEWRQTSIWRNAYGNAHRSGAAKPPFALPVVAQNIGLRVFRIADRETS